MIIKLHLLNFYKRGGYMKDLKDICKVALVQAAPVMFDKKAGLKKL